MSRARFLPVLLLAACGGEAPTSPADGPGPALAARVQAAWTVLAPLPTAVRAPAWASDPNRLFILGGSTAGGHSTLVQVYNARSRRWSSGPPFTGARDWAMAAAMADGVHLVGGVGAGLFADHQVLDLATRTWSSRAPMPIAADAAVSVVVAGRLFIIGGGTAGGPTGAVQIYHPATDSWSPGASMPTARLSAAFAVIGGAIYVAGGQTAGLGTTAVLERYDPLADTWTTLAPMPDVREALGGGNLGGQFCVFGGRYTNGNPTGGAFPDTWCYDPASDAWAQGPDMLSPRVEMASVEFKGALLAIAGRSAAAIVNRTVERLK